jgi:Ca-activated chloride channel family protein
VIFFLVIALARPRITSQESKSSWEVVDIMLVLDISGSMRAEDFKPNRLEAAKQEALDFVSARQHDRIGLVVFAGESYLQCPLTVDNVVVSNILRQVTFIDEKYDGTAIGMALAMGINRLRDSEVENKVLVLLSDGSNNAGELDPLTAARMATDYGITIHTIGIGREGKVPYPAINPFTGRKMLDYREMEMDEETLSDIAETTTGYYSRASDRVGLSSIFDELDKLERTEVSVTDYTEYREIFAWFLFPAVALAVSDRFIRGFWFRQRD